MPKIIIEHDPDIPFRRAAQYVARVMDDGRISQCNGVPMFCFVSRFVDNVEVVARDRKTAESADSFIVRRVEPAN